MALIPQKPEFVGPQAGPQEQFLSSSADIIFYGGAAGGGKSYGVLLEPLRHVTTVRDFSAVFFRRNTTQIKNPGGLWDDSYKIYPKAKGKPVSYRLEWNWRNVGGGKIRFAHLEHESTVLDWQGSQIPLIIFDELTHFSKTQFFYMLSRNRSVCGVRPYIRATTNPDADSWVAAFIDWWIGKDGYAIQERSGVIRWFVRLDDDIRWADTSEELVELYGCEPEDPKSFTFIASKLTDNKILMAADPGYMANLKAMSRVERERLLGGNWKIRPAAGLYFKRSEVTLLDRCPNDVEAWARGWDFAATEVSESNPDPDWTAGVLMGRRSNGRIVVVDAIHERCKSHAVRKLVMRTANNDTDATRIGLSQDPGQAGKDQVEEYAKMLFGYTTEIERETGDKVQRADSFAAAWQSGNVDVVRGPWNEAYFSELEAFPSKAHEDQVDASAKTFKMLLKNKSIFDAL